MTRPEAVTPDPGTQAAAAAALSAARAALASAPPKGWPRGWRLAGLDQVDSTQAVARAVLAAGEGPAAFPPDLGAPPVGDAIVAANQTGGRGRQARTWHSPTGNLYTSVLLRPDLPLARAPELGFVAALAVADTVSALAKGGEVRLKWPNDVLLNGGKVAGILAETEAVPGTPPDRMGALILGMGINLASAPAAPGLGGDHPALPPTAIAAVAGAPPPVAQARDHLVRVLARLLRRWQRSGFGAIRRNVESQMTGWGEPVTVTLGERRETGRLLGLAPNGALRLERPDGSEVALTAGDVTVGPRSALLGPRPASEAGR